MRSGGVGQRWRKQLQLAADDAANGIWPDINNPARGQAVVFRVARSSGEKVMAAAAMFCSR
jgi:hypothetical protein